MKSGKAAGLDDILVMIVEVLFTEFPKLTANAPSIIFYDDQMVKC